MIGQTRKDEDNDDNDEYDNTFFSHSEHEKKLNVLLVEVHVPISSNWCSPASVFNCCNFCF